ncbi:MAG: glycosyltransferase [Acidobacteriaceae bacterium]
MRFLHLIRSVDPRGGGPVEVLRQLGKVHQGLGHAVEACSLDDPEIPAVKNFPMGIHAFGPVQQSYGYSTRMAKWLTANRHTYNAVVVHGLWQYPLHVAYTELAGHVPYFVYPHGMLDPWFNQQFYLKHLKKVAYWHLIGRRALDAAAALIFTTDEELQRSSRAFFPYQWHALISPLGIEEPPAATTDKMFLWAQWPMLKDAKYLLFFGRIHPKKGCDLLLRGFAHVCKQDPQLRLVMAGPVDPPYLKQMQSLARELQIERQVDWTGMMSGGLKWELLRQADAFILPSHQENFAIAAAEALAVGTPALLSDKVQIWHDVVAANAGLAAPDTLEGTVSLLERWVALPAEQKERMRANAMACYKSRFTAEISGLKMLEQVTTRINHLNDCGLVSEQAFLTHSLAR